MTISSSFAAALGPATIRELAGPAYFERGRGYFEEGRVASLAVDGERLVARVKGTEDYRVRLWLEDGELGWECTCPLGYDDAFCKHCVAVALAARARGEGGERPGGPSKPALTLDDLRTYLEGQPQRTLVEWLVEQALDDDRLRERLLLCAARERAGGVDLSAFRGAIDHAVATGGFVDYHEAGGYARGIMDVADELGTLLEEGHADGVIDLSEYALHAVEEAIGHVDDSDGHMGEILVRLQELHHDACVRARPDPEELAERLFGWELDADYDTFLGAAATYADVLGPEGLARYRVLAGSEWAKLPALGPGERDSADDWPRHFHVTHMMETLTRLDGDLDALIAVMRRDLSSPYAFLRIAQAYRDAGRDDQALEWAERGVAAFTGTPDGRLREFLAEEYHRRGRHDEAMAIAWDSFAARPGLEQYRMLHEHAERAGRWPDWRERALGRLRQEVDDAKTRRRGDHWSPIRDHSELVRVFLWEGDAESAWREAQAGGCSPGLWLELARRREAEHPEDALPIYRRTAEATIARTSNDAYREAVELLGRIRELLGRLGREAEFGEYVAGLRAEHRRKRNFMKLLDAAGWG